ncbi:hypothetical protein HY68_36530 [Streptomyces sp. AcH 505]|uniref:hypothetical protein n=1 Tax=Streptomyces sp. AcH 505 TaxID=352211 RepID=UPI0005920215|nr:hypothetical protein HY68_36530 [Streptomyces sp. AcH 505]
MALPKTRPEESNLVAHARRELRILEEDPDTIRGICDVVHAFAKMGHSGGSAPYAISYLERLLRYEPLSELTDDPSEWLDRHAEGMTTSPLWQSVRHPDAMSTDGGKTYILLSEQTAAGDLTTTPLHRSKTVPMPDLPADEVSG